MSTTRDWMPTSRNGQLVMARNWINIFNENTKDSQGANVKKYVAWGIPSAAFIELGGVFGEAQEALQAAQKAETRTSVATTRCNTAFEALTTVMRDIKRRHFFVPPLTNADLVSLGLTPPDTIPTPIGPPVTQVGAEISYPGRHQHRLRIIPVSGHAYDERSEYGFKMVWGYYPPGGATTEQALSDRHYLMNPPETPEQLASGAKFTRRKIDLIEHPYETSGMTCYYCIRYENQTGGQGPWGPIFSAVIP